MVRAPCGRFARPWSWRATRSPAPARRSGRGGCRPRAPRGGSRASGPPAPAAAPVWAAPLTLGAGGRRSAQRLSSARRTSSELTYSTPLEVEEIREHAQHLPTGAALADRARRAGPALPSALGVHERARALRETSHGQHHVRGRSQPLGEVGGRGDHELGLRERIRPRRQVVVRIEGAEQHVALEPLLQHGRRAEAGGGGRHAARLAMRHRAGQVGAGGVRTLGDQSERRARQRRERRGERADFGIRRMALGERAQEDRVPPAVAERRGGGAMRIRHLHGGHARAARACRPHRRRGAHQRRKPRREGRERRARRPPETGSRARAD